MAKFEIGDKIIKISSEGSKFSKGEIATVDYINGDTLKVNTKYVKSFGTNTKWWELYKPNLLDWLEKQKR